MLRIRRNTLLAATLCAAVTLLLPGPVVAGEFVNLLPAGAEQAHAADPDGLRKLLRPAVVDSIAAWGVRPEDVVGDVIRLDAGELARVVDEAQRLVWRDWRQSARYQAMYLVLVTEVRESLLLARVLSRKRSAGAGEREPAAAR